MVCSSYPSQSDSPSRSPKIGPLDAVETAACVKYPTVDALEAVFRDAARAGGFDLVKERSKKDKKGLCRKVWFKCIHGGSYFSRREFLTDENRLRKTSTLKLECNWSAVAQRQTSVGHPDTWSVDVIQSSHTHPMSSLSAYASARCMNLDEESVLQTLSKAGAAPKTILAAINDSRMSVGNEIPLIAQDIYNARKRVRLDALKGRSPVEAVLDELEQNDVWHRVKVDSEGHVTHLFFIPNETADLLNRFHTVLLIDCTYKSNR